MNLQLNLATRVYVNYRQLNIIITVIIVVAGCWMYVNLYRVSNNISEINQLSGKTRLSGQSNKAVQVSDKDYQALMGRINFFNTELRKRSFDWLLLLDNLETVVPDGIALTDIKPGKKGEITLSGSARQFTNIRIFVENLESSKYFKDVFLLNQTGAQLSVEHKGLSFSISCKATN